MPSTKMCQEVFSYASHILTTLTLIFVITADNWVVFTYNVVIFFHFFTITQSLKNYWLPSCYFYVWEAMIFTVASYSIVVLIYEKLNEQEKVVELYQLKWTLWNCFTFVADFIGIVIHASSFNGWNFDEPQSQENEEPRGKYESFEPIDNVPVRDVNL